MKKSFLTLLLFYFYLSAFAQNPLQPPSWVNQETDVFKVVESPPMFPGCEDGATLGERRSCANERMLRFFSDNLRYPKNGACVEGTVVVSFIVEADGSLTDAKVVRDLGAGCGKEALRVVGLMPKWNPGLWRGQPVRVEFHLPVKFKLE